MKKVFAVFAVLLFLSSVFAATDLSGLYSVTTKPTVRKIVSKFGQFKRSIKGLKLEDHQKRAFKVLESSMKVHVQPATLKKQDSRGPKWKKLAEEYLEKEHDLHENASYTDEDGDATEECNFDEDGANQMDMYYLTWSSVKRIKGSQESIAYIVNLMVPVQGRNKDTGEMEWCQHHRSEFGFEAKLKDAKPVEIMLD